MAKIQAEHLYKVFGSHPKRGVELLQDGVHRSEVYERTGQFGAVNDATFEVAEGHLFVVMGLSGSGKSTLVRMVNRLHEPTSGTVHIDDVDIGALTAKALRALRAEHISMVFQSFALFPHRSVRDNAAYGLEVRKVDKEERYERADKALETVGLTGWGDRVPSELSGGMRQRVGLARGLATDAEILLMDEPFSALDPLIRRDMQQLLLELQRTLRKTVMFITHDLNEAMLLGDRIAMMKDGYIVQNDTPERILNHPADDYVAEFVQDVDRSRIIPAEAVMVEPLRTLAPGDDPTVALRQMREMRSSQLYVLGEDRRLLGAVGDDDLVDASKQGIARVDEVVHQRYPTTDRATPIIQLFRLAARSALPIAVVDDERLVGVVPRPTLLEALSAADEDTADDEGVADATVGAVASPADS